MSFNDANSRRISTTYSITPTPPTPYQHLAAAGITSLDYQSTIAQPLPVVGLVSTSALSNSAVALNNFNVIQATIDKVHAVGGGTVSLPYAGSFPIASTTFTKYGDVSFEIGSAVTFNVSGSFVAPFTPALPRWNAARGRALARVSSPKIVCLGDSMTAGSGSNGSLSSSCRFMSWPSQVARILDARGLPTSLGNVMGDSLSVAGTADLYPIYDPRVTLGAGWARIPATISILGGQAFGNTSNTNALAFTPADPFDTIMVQYVQASGHGTFTIDVDGGAAITTISANGASALLQTAELPCALSTHTINIKRTGAGADVDISGISAYQKNTTSRMEVQVLNGGMVGGKCNGAYPNGVLNTSNAIWNRRSSISAWAPDLVVFLMGYNDATGGDAASTYKANIQSTVDLFYPTSDFVFFSLLPALSTNITPTIQDQYRLAVKDIATNINAPVIDMYTRWGDFANISSTLYFDTVHPNGIGYSDMASVLANLLLQ